jgi:hypothetical protein
MLLSSSDEETKTGSLGINYKLVTCLPSCGFFNSAQIFLALRSQKTIVEPLVVAIRLIPSKVSVKKLIA